MRNPIEDMCNDCTQIPPAQGTAACYECGESMCDADTRTYIEQKRTYSDDPEPGWHVKSTERVRCYMCAAVAAVADAKCALNKAEDRLTCGIPSWYSKGRIAYAESAAEDALIAVLDAFPNLKPLYGGEK